MSEQWALRRDEGSSTPFVLLCVLIAGLLVAGVSAASQAFLAQRDLQADCDGAALAAASSIDVGALYRGEVTLDDALPIAAAQARDAVRDYQATGFAGDPTLEMATFVAADRVTVVCARTVAVPFGAALGLGDGVRRETASSATSPLAP